MELAHWAHSYYILRFHVFENPDSTKYEVQTLKYEILFKIKRTSKNTNSITN